MRRGTERAGRWQLTLALGLLVIGAAAAHAQSVADHLSQCQDEKGTAAARISACTRAITQTDNDDLKGEALLQRGVLHEVNGETVAAVNDYTEAIKIDGNNALAYFNRGNANDQLGNYDLAIADYTEAIKIDAKDPDFLNNRGQTYDAKGDHDRAIADYTEAIRLNAKSALTFYNRGLSYANKSDYTNAVADFDRAIALDPEDLISTWHARPPMRNSATIVLHVPTIAACSSESQITKTPSKASIASAISSRNDKKDRPEAMLPADRT